MRLEGYVREYPVGQGPSSLGSSRISAEDQREAIEAYAKKLGGRVCAWHYDASLLVSDGDGSVGDGVMTISAGEWSEVARGLAAASGQVTVGRLARPGLQAALRRLGAGEADGIVVMTMDRVAPTAAEADTVFRGIVDAGRVFASCQERLDPETSPDEYARSLMRMPPPHPREVILRVERERRMGRPVEQRRQRGAPPPAPSGGQVGSLWRRILAACAVPLAALGVIRSPASSPPPPAVQPVMVQKVEISLSGEKGSSEPPPGSDYRAIASLVGELDSPVESKSGLRVVRKRTVAGPELAKMLKEYGRRRNSAEADPRR